MKKLKIIFLFLAVIFMASCTTQLKENQSILFKADSILAPVSASLKNINYTGSSDAAVLYIMLLTADSYH